MTTHQMRSMSLDRLGARFGFTAYSVKGIA